LGKSKSTSHGSSQTHLLVELAIIPQRVLTAHWTSLSHNYVLGLLVIGVEQRLTGGIRRRLAQTNHRVLETIAGRVESGTFICGLVFVVAHYFNIGRDHTHHHVVDVDEIIISVWELKEIIINNT
jgi:hypothetical protein